MKKSVVMLMVSIFLTACAAPKTGEVEQSPAVNPEVKSMQTVITSSPVASPVTKTESSTSEDDTIKEYIAKEFGKTSGSEKVFVAYKQLGREEKEGGNEMHLIALIETASKVNNEIKKSGDTLLPLSVTLQEQSGGAIQVAGHQSLTEQQYSITPEAQTTMKKQLQEELDTQIHTFFNS